MRGRRQNGYQISALLQEAEKEKMERKIVERTILTCDTAQSVIEAGVHNYLENLKEKPKSKYEYNQERKRDFRVGKKKVEHRPLFYLDPEDDKPTVAEELVEEEVKPSEHVVLTAANLKDYNKQKKRDFSLSRSSPKKTTRKIENEPEAKPKEFSLEALSAKKEQADQEKAEKELEESIAKTKYQYNQERKRNFTFGKISWTPKEDPLLAALKKKQQEKEKVQQASPFPEVQIDPNNFLRSYKYENFQETIKYLQHYQYHLQFNNIAKLDLSNQALDDSHIDLLCSAVKQQQGLSQLNLSNNQITDKGIYAFAQILRSLSHLKQLNLAWNRFTDYSMKLLTDPNYYSTSIEEYNLSYNKLTTLGAYYLCLWYTKSYQCHVKKLILGGFIHHTHSHYWGDAFLQLFVGELLSLEISRLEELTLYPFQITEEGFDCLLILLFANRHRLRKLNISHNFIVNYYYRQFFVQAIQFLTQRNRDMNEHLSFISSSSPSGAIAGTSKASEVHSFQFLAYDCGFSLEEIQYFQELFIESECTERKLFRPMIKSSSKPTATAPSRRSSATAAKPDKRFSTSSTPLGPEAIKGQESAATTTPMSTVAPRQSNLSTVIFIPSSTGYDIQRSIFSLQQYSTIQWKSLLMLGGRLHAIYYHCLFAVYQIKMGLMNSWKLTAPMKYRPPIVLTSQNASQYKVHRGRPSTRPRSTIGLLSMKQATITATDEEDLLSIEELIPSLLQKKNGRVKEIGEEEEEEEEEEDFQQRYLEESETSSSLLHPDGSLSSAIENPVPTSTSILPPISQAMRSVPPSPPKPAVTLPEASDNPLKTASQVTETTNDTYIYENEQSLLANLTKRLPFPLELLFVWSKKQASSSAKVAGDLHQKKDKTTTSSSSLLASLTQLKSSIITLNDELNYVHFYQELIGQLNTLQFTTGFHRSVEQLQQLYQELEVYNQMVWYTSLYATTTTTPETSTKTVSKGMIPTIHESKLERVQENEDDSEEEEGVKEDEEASKSKHQENNRPIAISKDSQRMNKHSSSRGFLKQQLSTSSLVSNLSRHSSSAELFSKPAILPDRVFTEDMKEQQIRFFQHLREKATYYLQKWSQSIDQCLLVLEEYCLDVYQQNQSALTLFQNRLFSKSSSKRRNPEASSSSVKMSAMTLPNEQRLEQTLFMLEDCYAQTMRLGMIDEEYIGCLYQQNIIHHYISEKKAIIANFHQREEQEAFELEQREQARLAKQRSHHNHHHHQASASKNEEEEEETVELDPNELLRGKGSSKKEKGILTTKAKYHLKHHLHDIKKLIQEDEQHLFFLSLSFYQYLHEELNMNFEFSLSYLSYFFHYYCFVYQKEKYKL